MTAVSRPKLPTALGDSPALALEPGLRIEGIQLEQANWAGQTVRRVQLDTVRLLAPDLTGAKLRDSSWTDTEVRNGQMAGLDLAGAAIRRVVIAASRLDGLILAETEARDLVISDSKLNLANLRFLKWSRIEFVRCSLAEADFAGATIKDAVFRDCDLRGCDFSGATLTNVDLRSSTLAELRGLSGLKGATIGIGQLMSLAPELAANLGISVEE